MLAVLITAAALAAPTGFYEARVLEPAAAFVAAKPARVWCASTTRAWRSFLDATGGGDADGSSVPGSSEMKLSPAACAFLRAAHSAALPASEGLAASILVVTHEAIHLRGERDEGVTDCAAVHEMPRVAVRFFHVRAGRALRALMAQAWTYRGSEAAVYRSVC